MVSQVLAREASIRSGAVPTTGLENATARVRTVVSAVHVLSRLFDRRRVLGSRNGNLENTLEIGHVIYIVLSIGNGVGDDLPNSQNVGGELRVPEIGNHGEAHRVLIPKGLVHGRIRSSDDRKVDTLGKQGHLARIELEGARFDINGTFGLGGGYALLVERSASVFGEWSSGEKEGRRELRILTVYIKIEVKPITSTELGSRHPVSRKLSRTEFTSQLLKRAHGITEHDAVGSYGYGEGDFLFVAIYLQSANADSPILAFILDIKIATIKDQGTTLRMSVCFV
jgi:hypothetical protein